MKFDHVVRVSADKATVQAFLDDVPAAAKCLPGVEDVHAVETDVYDGRIRVRIGPLGLNIAGRARLHRGDDDAWRLQGEGRDGRAGAGVKAALEARLTELSPSETEVRLSADVQLSGRLAELGQPLIKRKADAMVQEFGENLRRTLSTA
jgi:carbon monoxide dehydrogenase subunit G